MTTAISPTSPPVGPVAERSAANQPLSPGQRLGLLALLASLVVFGVVVEIRSAFLQRRMGDVSVYFRAGWAARTGVDPYSVADENKWHYVYPPVFAVLMIPFADPPPGADRAGYCPYPLAVGAWYALSLVFLWLGVDWLANALEERRDRGAGDGESPGVRRFGRRWWAVRVLPVVVCLPAIARTVARGQVNLLVVFLICGMIAESLRRRGFRAGVCLGGAICIKLIPAFLVLAPLWRRDVKTLAGVAAGLLLGVVIIPVAAFGPARALELHQTFAEVLIKPAVGAGTDRSRAEELTDVTATDTQSLLATLHNTVHLDRMTRPRESDPWVRRSALAIGGLMTLVTLLAAGGRAGTRSHEVLFAGSLVLVMLLLSPVCHFHYFALLVPLTMGVVSAGWERSGYPRLGPVLAAVLAVQVVANLVTALPGATVEVLRDVGVSMYAGLALWVAGVVLMLGDRYRRSAPVPGLSAPVFSRSGARP